LQQYQYHLTAKVISRLFVQEEERVNFDKIAFHPGLFFVKLRPGAGAVTCLEYFRSLKWLKVLRPNSYY
jgi:hypothetical protein